MKDLADTGNGFQFLHISCGGGAGESIDDPDIAEGGYGAGPGEIGKLFLCAFSGGITGSLQGGKNLAPHFCPSHIIEFSCPAEEGGAIPEKLLVEPCRSPDPGSRTGLFESWVYPYSFLGEGFHKGLGLAMERAGKQGDQSEADHQESKSDCSTNSRVYGQFFTGGGEEKG